MAKFLDTSGLTYLWGKITNALNAKANVADLADVATSGSYSDLSGVPTQGFNMQFNSDGSINAVNRPIQLNGVQKQGAATHTAINFIPGSNIQIETTDSSNATNWTFSATNTKPGTPTNVVPANSKTIESGGTWKNLEKMNLPVGHLCLVTVHAQYENNTTGYRSVGIGGEGGSATSPLGAHYQLTLSPANGAASNLVLTVFFVPESGVDYYIITRHTIGSSKSCTYRYRFVTLN